MWSFKTFSALLLLLLFHASHEFARAADPRFATTFVVGPEPLPLALDTSDSSLPNGARKLREHQSPAQERSPSHNIERHGQWKPSAARRVHGAGGTNTKPRSLQADVCSVTNTILGFNFTDIFSENATAAILSSDPHGAVGVSRLVSAVRWKMEVRQKDGTLTFRESFQNFFTGFPEVSDPGTRFQNPKVVYDEHAGRFVMVTLQRTDVPEVSRIWVAVSKNETPDSVSDWYKTVINAATSIDSSNTRGNYPCVEVDEEAVYITANMYRVSDGSFAGSRLWIVNKGVDSGFYGGGAISVVTSNPYAIGGTAGTTVPAQVHGASGVDGSVGTFFSSVFSYSGGRVVLQILTLFNPLSTNPTLSLQRIPLGLLYQGGEIPLASQYGTNVLIDTGDVFPEMVDAVWRKNKLWVVFTISSRFGVNKGQPTVHWVRMGTSGGSVTFEAQGDLGGEGISAVAHTYFPSVAVNSQGVVAYGYSASSTTTYVGAYAAVGSSEESYTVKNGLAPYNRTREGSTFSRWGAYSGISVDPIDDSFWVFNQYADTVGSADSNGDGRWGTVWGRLACVTSPASSPVSAPKEYPCGWFGLSLFCPITSCGPLGRLLGLCHRTKS